MRARKTHLVIIDFAGTLSLETVLFGRDENLAAELARSGLTRLGADSPEIFWNELVLPCWAEGSLTARGYEAVLAERLKKFTNSRGRPAPEAAIHAAARSFTQSYFTRSLIEPAWKETLTRLAAAKDALTLIATDHYAEATDCIRGQLSRWNIAARPLLSGPQTGEQTAAPAEAAPCIIANSAGIGAHKADAVFWKTVKAALENSLREPFASLCVVDDFGFNENAADDYGGREKALLRREKTAAHIQEAFGREPRVFSFFLEGEQDGDDMRRNYEALVLRASEFIFSGMG
jgi:hypothetical protein